MQKQPLTSTPDHFNSQPVHAKNLSLDAINKLIISIIEVDGIWVIKSRYQDDKWELTGGPTNESKSSRTLNFQRIPESFRAVMKAVMYRYLRRGRAGQVRPQLSTLRLLFTNVLPFLEHAANLRVYSLAEVTPLVCSTYIEACRSGTRKIRKGGGPLASKTLAQRFLAVEGLYELSQYTADPMPSHPWPNESASQLAGQTGANDPKKRGNTTPLIPDDVFSKLFQKAWGIVEHADSLLTLRDQIGEVAPELDKAGTSLRKDRNRQLQIGGWSKGAREFNTALTEIRTACYIVIASVSGCRNHELALVKTGSWYCTEGDDGEVYWWMRSQSLKTDEGHTEWMIPEAAVTALKIMDHWAQPHQAMLEAEIARLRTRNPEDPKIAEAQRHVGAVFLGLTPQKGNEVRTLSKESWSELLKPFAKKCGLDWNLNTHQFRRKFANYAARSQFGDLRYLREHFKHWSMDMALGYALNESQEMELYLEIERELETIKEDVTSLWLQPDEPLSGGYGQNIMRWRGNEAVTLFKSHPHMVRSIAESTAIRSNGHAWCTADDNLCVGNDMEKTRCTSCSNAVIGSKHANLYQRLYDDLKEVRRCEDIGETGKARVHRDMERCRSVLISLGYDPERTTI